MDIDYSKIIDRYNPQDCYCLSGISPVDTVESVVCINCGYSSSPIYSCYEDNKEGELQGYIGNTTDSLFSSAFNMRTTTSDNSLNKKLLWMFMTYDDTVIFNVKKIIEEKGYNLRLTKCIVDNALHYFKKFIGYKDENGNKNIFKGHNKIAIIAVCVFYSCRETDSINYIQNDICECFEVEKKTFDEYSKMFHKRVEYKKEYETSFKDIIRNTASKIHLDMKHTNVCVKIGDALQKFGILSEVSYTNTAIGIVVFVLTETHINFNKDDLLNKFNITYATLNKILKTLTEQKVNIYTYIKSEK